MRWTTSLAILIHAAALWAALVGVPVVLTEYYGDTAYPWLQATLTPLSNRTVLPLFDLTWMLVVCGLLAGGAWSWRRAPRARRWRSARRSLVAATTTAAMLYLWFLLAWGHNYRRAGVEARLAEFEAGRATPAAVRALAERAVGEANRLHEPAHAQGFPTIDAVPRPLVDALHAVERSMGRRRATVPARPKRPLTTPYLRAVGVSGMLAPFYLETYLNPDLTGPERPYVLAHEWAHLSGFAPEEDASFVGVLAALGADAPAQYSGWLFLVGEAAGRLQPVTRQLVLEALAAGPRADLAEIARRQQASRVPWLDRASWVAYDRAIKSQGADAGIAGYGRVIELLLGSGRLERKDFP